MTSAVHDEFPLRGKRLALVEDETLVAMLLEEVLFDLGAGAVDIASSVETALLLLDRARPDFVILDLNLGGQPSYPVAERLESVGVPFLFLTGYGIDGIATSWQSRPILQKPASFEMLGKTISTILRARSAA